MHENKILCEYDYEERMVFANLSHNINSLDQVRRKTKEVNGIGGGGGGVGAGGVGELCDASSGYGSGDSPFDHWTNSLEAISGH